MTQRPIKFRQRLSNGFHYWGFIGSGFISPTSSSTGENGLNTPSDQFTGLTDKNGVEIYEGDIVRWGRQGSPICQVIFDAPSFKLEEITREADRFDRYDHRDIEVIGNIYESPELLSPK